MGEARAKVALQSVGIDALQVSRALTGALHFGVSGEGREAKADALASRLRDVFSGRDGVTVARPEKTAELRIRGMEDSVTAVDIASAVAEFGGCRPESVRVGAINMAPGGLGSAWVRCPVQTARKAVGAGCLIIGWSSCKVELLPQRPLQCFKCLEGGHVRAKCPNVADRSGRCYRCGSTDHIARTCTQDTRCPVCTDLGLPAGHRAGSKACRPARRKGDREGGKKGTGTGTRGSGAPSAGPKVSAGGAGGTGSKAPAQPPPSATPSSHERKRVERKRARREVSLSSSEEEDVRRASMKGARLEALLEMPLEKRLLRHARGAADEQQPSGSTQESTPMEAPEEDLVVPDL